MLEFIAVCVGFMCGCLFTYLVLYRPAMKLSEEYQERLRQQIKNRS